MGPILLTAVAAAVPVVVWRIHASHPAAWLAWLAGGLAVVAIGVGLATGLRRTMAGEAGVPRRLGAVAGLAAAVALLGSWEALWPCSVGCSEAAAYGELLGLPTAIVAGILLAVVAAIGLTQAHRTRIQPLAELLGWTAVGGSAYFLFLSAELEILCSHCLAVHGVVLCLPAALIAGSGLRPGERLGAVVIAALALHAWYHPIGAASAPVRVEGELSVADLRLLQRADLGRRHGDPQAPLRAELALSMHCELCRQHLPQLLAALRPAIRRGELHLVLRHVDPTRDAAGFGRWTLLAAAAAADDRHLAFLDAHLGAPLEGDGATLDPAWQRLDEIANAYRVPLALLLATDADQVRRFGMGATPTLLLFTRGRGEPIATWSGHIDAAAVAAAVRNAAPIGL